MKKYVVLFVMLVALTGCASFDVGEHAGELCEIYQTVRPDVVEGRDIIKASFDQFSPEAQETFRRIDEELPKIDNAGQLVCEVARLGGSGRGVDWNAVTSAVIKGVSLAARLRAEGVI